MVTANFKHFSNGSVSFLLDLKANNSRDWFQANKKTYEHAIKAPSKAFCVSFAERLHSLTGIEHEFKIFRINRDVRFSKDKTPYNTHLRISFFPLISVPIRPAWFFSLETDKLIFGAGVFMLAKEQLLALRNRVDGIEGSQLREILMELRTNSVRISDPELKRVPAPFAKDHVRAELLKHKSLSAWHDFPNTNFATSKDLLPTLITKAQTIKPLFDWLGQPG